MATAIAICDLPSKTISVSEASAVSSEFELIAAASSDEFQFKSAQDYPAVDYGAALIASSHAALYALDGDEILDQWIRGQLSQTTQGNPRLASVGEDVGGDLLVERLGQTIELVSEAESLL